jgi:hypothetical protein
MRGDSVAVTAIVADLQKHSKNVTSNSREISRSRVDRQNLQQRPPLTLPYGGEQALRRSASSGCEKKKQSRDDTRHCLLQADGWPRHAVGLSASLFSPRRRSAVVRAPQGAITPQVGDTFRLLDVQLGLEDDGLKPVVLTLSTFSEAYKR